MKQEEELKTLILSLMEMDTLHQEYCDNNCKFVVDSLKEGDTLIIKVTLKENKDKQEFEKWLEQIDDDLFSEVLDELKKEGLADLNSLYSSKDYMKVITKIKSKTKEIAARRIKKLQKLVN